MESTQWRTCFSQLLTMEQRMVGYNEKEISSSFPTIPLGLPKKSTFGNDENLNYGFREVEMRTGTVGRILSTSPPSYYNSSLIHEFATEQTLMLLLLHFYHFSR